MTDCRRRDCSCSICEGSEDVVVDDVTAATAGAAADAGSIVVGADGGGNDKGALVHQIGDKTQLFLAWEAVCRCVVVFVAGPGSAQKMALSSRYGLVSKNGKKSY